MAQDVKLHPNTFTKYLKEAISKGYIIDLGSHYKLIKFVDVVRDFNSDTQLIFNNHGVLKDKCSDFDVNLKNLENLLFIDNIYTKQEKAIKVKKEKKRLLSILMRTDKSYVHPSDYKRARRLLKKAKTMSGVAAMDKSLSLDLTIRTSARHAGNLMGMSAPKANKILNNLAGYGRKILVEWFPLVGGVEQILHLREMNPNAVVYAMPFIGKVKVCSGSAIFKKRCKSYIHNLSM